MDNSGWKKEGSILMAEEGSTISIIAVSYTHLDVYKRQDATRARRALDATKEAYEVASTL